MIDVSIITNCHREGRLAHATILAVRACIETARQAGLSIDWYVVRDRPDQATIQYTNRNCIPDAQIIDVDFGDLSLARNAGTGEAKGRYLAFIDGDDLWSRSWIINAHTFIESLPHGQFVLHPEWAIFFEGREFLWQVRDCCDPDFDPRSLLAYNSWCMSSFASREVYIEHPYRPIDVDGGFGYEDWHWNCDTTYAGIKHKIVPETIYCVRVKSWQESLVAKSNERKCIMPPSRLFASKFGV